MGSATQPTSPTKSFRWATRRPRIVIAESSGFSDTARYRLQQLGDVEFCDLDRPGLLHAVGQADILWVRLRNRIDDEVFVRAPALRYLVTPTTGLNHIDLDAASRRNIEVLSLRGDTEFLRDVRATAELTVGLMLAILRNIPNASAHVNTGGWNRDTFRGRELHGKTVGLVGCGRLGQLVAACLQGFDVRLLAADPYLTPDAVPPAVELVSLERLLDESDIVSLHVNLCRQTERFFGADQLQRMKPCAWLINTARGELIDETALLSALRLRRLAGAALDVLSDETSTGMGSYPLVAYARENDNLIITPHIGGCTQESMEKTELRLVNKLQERLATAAECKNSGTEGTCTHSGLSE